MRTLRKQRAGIWVALVAILSSSLLYSCEEDEDYLREKAEKAAKEMCRCLQDKSKSKCESELEDNYRSHLSQEFVDLFNEVQTCGITLTLTRLEAPNENKLILINK